MSEPLKPCPFCGGVAVSADNYVYVTRCECMAEMGPGETDSRAEAIEKWNRRAAPALSKEVREAIEWAILAFNGARDMAKYEATLRSFLSVSTEGLK